MVTRRIAWASFAAVVIALVVAYVLLARSSGTPLDPHNPGSDGSQAVANVLKDKGIHVRVVAGVDDLRDQPPSGTLVISRPDALSDTALRAALRTDVHRIVLIDPDADTLDATGLPVHARDHGRDSVAAGRCDIPWLRGLRIGAVDHTYAPDGAAHTSRCQSVGRGGSAVLAVSGRPAAPRVVLVGSTDVLRNATVRRHDNAAFALRVLGRDDRLVWLSTAPGGPDTATHSTPWPDWSVPALIVVAGAVLLLLLWRGRRLGPLVHEPLPVVVPAHEITTARGQLYRKARDTERAGAVLRYATRERLREQLRLPPGCPPETLVEATAAATGRDPAQIRELLFGPPAGDETTMTSVAQQLSTVERQVRP